MGIDAQLMQGGRCVLARLRLQRQLFETTTTPLRIEEVVFASVGADRAKCLKPRALFQLPILRILDCRDATAIEARIHLAWQRHTAQIAETEAWLTSIGAEADCEEERSVVSFPLAGEDPAARGRMLDRRRVILPGRGPLSGMSLSRANDRLFTVQPGIDSGIDLEISVSTRLEELARLEHRLAEERRVDALNQERAVADGPPHQRHPCALLVGPQISQERACIESLRVRGYRVGVAASERDAISAFDKYSPELLLADVSLGRSEAIDLITSIRKVPGVEEVPVILLDSKNRPDRREVAKRMGAAGYLVYPLNVSKIADRLWHIISEPRRRRFTRYPQKVSVSLEGTARPCLATAIGRGGMFLKTEDDLPTSTLRNCRLTLPELGANLRVQGEVLYRARTSTSAERGVGVRFHRFEDSDESLLIRFLSNIHPDAPAPAI